MPETVGVLTMLNAKASRQLNNKQLDEAKRTVQEAVRYYNAFIIRRMAQSSSNTSSTSSCCSNSSTYSSDSPHQVNLVRCQGQLSVLLQLKIGRLEVAVGTQANNDHLIQSATRTIAKCTRKLHLMLLQDQNQNQ